MTTHAPWPPRAGLGSDLVSIKSVAEGPEVFAVLGGHDTPEHYYADVWVASAEGAPPRCPYLLCPSARTRCHV